MGQTALVSPAVLRLRWQEHESLRTLRDESEVEVMVLSVRKWMGRLLFIVLFVMLTIMTFGGYRWLIGVVAPVDPYRTPHGNALKVNGPVYSLPEGGSLSDRLRWFYWYGE